MPEGDTIARTARSLGQWLEGRTITAARTTAAQAPVHKLVGQTVTEVEARAKHLLIRFDSGMSLHTHMRMAGTWHVYREGDRWRKPAHQARVVLQAGERLAVCFNAPVVELLAAKGEQRHPALTRLGPDVLHHPLDLAEIGRRLRTRPPETSIGQALLDQQVVSGIGNIYRCEALFACGVHPVTPVEALDPATVDALVTAAARLMHAAVDPGARRPPNRVYGRAGRPCHRCRTAIEAAKLGEPPRTAYWCPMCQRSQAGSASSSG
jgi:endonuclease-8